MPWPGDTLVDGRVYGRCAHVIGAGVHRRALSRHGAPVLERPQSGHRCALVVQVLLCVDRNAILLLHYPIAGLDTPFDVQRVPAGGWLVGWVGA